ncbi:MAG TPA: cytochrome P450 [Actinocatenispora sp.]
MTEPPLPTRRDCPYELPAGYRELRADGPLTRVRLPDGRGVWLVTGYAEARALLADPRLSSDRSHPDFPVPARPTAERRRASLNGTLIGTDPPAHDRQRRLLAARFTARRVAALRPEIHRVVDDRLDRMVAAGHADLVADFALPVPSIVICGLLGVPYDDHAFFEQQARLRLDADRGPEAMQRLTDYLADLMRRKRRRPGDGLLDELVAGPLAAGTVDTATVLSLALVLLVAGHGSSANMLSLGALTALVHPDLAAGLRDTRARPSAVDELLRYLSVVTVAPRRATADIPVAGRLVRAGDGVLVGLAAANHDPAYVPAPDRLDPGRPVRGHLAFGHGIHQCLGASLARAELDIAYGALFTRLPALRLAVPVDRVPVERGLLGGLAELPVTW